MNGIKEIECMHLADVISGINFKRVQTGLDAILDDCDYFAPLPSNIRGLVVEKKKFVFSPQPEDLEYSVPLSPESRQMLIARSRFSDDKYLENFFENQILNQARKATILSQGCFVFDSDDPFIASLISKAEEILASEPLKQMTKRYLNFLAISFVSTRYGRLVHEDFFLAINLQERAIAALLGFKDYKPLNERMGELSCLYNYTRR